MEIEKKTVSTVKTVYEGDVKSSAEGSIIVPDTKPDVLKICEVTAEAYLAEKQIEDGKITLKGKVRVNILYLPESNDKKLESINGCLEFCETVKKNEFKEDMTLCAFCDVDKVSYKLLNSRKIGLETKILINLCVFSNEQKDVVESVSSDNAETKSKQIAMTGRQQYDEFDFIVDEEIAFPKGKKAAQILKADMCVASKETKALDGKFVIKGRIGVNLLYADTEGRCNHLDSEIPFTEVFDVNGLAEDQDFEVSCEIGETAYEMTNAEDDTSSVAVRANVTVGIKTEQEETISAVGDCYFTDADCKFVYEDVKLQNVAAQVHFSTVIKQLLQKAEGAPDIMSVYRVQAKPIITSSEIKDGKLSVSGKVIMYVMYITEDAENPIASIKEEVPFNYIIDCEGKISEKDKSILCVECEHISYVINSKDAVEVRCGLVISGKIISVFDEKIISDIVAEARQNEKSGIVIYFAKDGDDLWDIAKNYHVKTDAIRQINGLDEEQKLRAGEKLIIPLC